MVCRVSLVRAAVYSQQQQFQQLLKTDFFNRYWAHS